MTALPESSLTVKAGAQELTFFIDAGTYLEVRLIAKRIQAEQPGKPSPRVTDFFEAGNTVLVRYREESGRNHALDASRVGSTGAGGGSVSDPEKIADGNSVTASQLPLRAAVARSRSSSPRTPTCSRAAPARPPRPPAAPRHSRPSCTRAIPSV